MFFMHIFRIEAHLCDMFFMRYSKLLHTNKWMTLPAFSRDSVFFNLWLLDAPLLLLYVNEVFHSLCFRNMSCVYFYIWTMLNDFALLQNFASQMAGGFDDKAGGAQMGVMQGPMVSIA